MMKKTLCALTLATLSIFLLNAEEDFRKTAIVKGEAEVFKAYTKANIAIDSELKKSYVELAQQQVAEKKAEVGTISFNGLAALDMSFALVNGIAALALAKGIHSDYEKRKNDQTNKDDTYLGKDWTNTGLVALGVTNFLKACLGLYKDLQKKDKGYERLEKAEKVLRAVESLPTK